MKKVLCIILAILLLFSLAACSQKESAKNTGSAADAELTEDPDKEVSPIYGQDPLAIIPGNYTAIGKKAVAVIKPLEIGKVNITVNTTDDLLNYTEWSMTGSIDDNLTIDFSDDVMKKVTLSKDSIILDENVVYIDGNGKVIFDKNELKFTWEDKKSEQGALTFGKE